MVRVKPGTKLHVTNLTPGSSNADLRGIFSPHGTVTECEVIKDFAFVHFKTKEEADDAVNALNGFSFNGKQLKVNRSTNLNEGLKGTKLFVAHVGKGTTVQDLTAIFNTCGNVTECAIIEDKEYAFVHYECKDQADDAIEKLNNYNLNGKDLHVMASTHGKKTENTESKRGYDDSYGFSSKNRGNSYRDPYFDPFVDAAPRRPFDMFEGYSGQPSRTAKVFVGNLPHHCSERALYNLFSYYGRVVECTVKGQYAFIHFPTRESAEVAVNSLNGYNLMGSKIRVQHSLKRGEEESKEVDGSNPNKRLKTDAVQIDFHSSKFCPFSQQINLALLLKGLEFNDVPGESDDNSPQWFQHAPSKGPHIEVKGKKIYHPSICIEFIDEFWPSTPNLLPNSSYDRAYVRIWCDHILKKVIPHFYDIILGNTNSKDASTKLLDQLTILTDAANIGGPFFMGSEPGLVDIILVPFLIRFEILNQYFGFEIPQSDEFDRLRKWFDALVSLKVVQQTIPDMTQLYESYKKYIPDVKCNGLNGTATSTIL